MPASESRTLPLQIYRCDRCMSALTCPNNFVEYDTNELLSVACPFWFWPYLADNEALMELVRPLLASVRNGLQRQVDLLNPLRRSFKLVEVDLLKVSAHLAEGNVIAHPAEAGNKSK